MDEEISYNDTSIDYMEEIQECDRNREIKDLLNDPCLGKIFDKGEIDDEIVYNGNVEDIKVDWIRAIQNEVDKMNADLAKAGIYNKLQQKRITALADIRNSAAHGKPEEFSDNDVTTMIRDIEQFLIIHLS